MLKNSYEEEEKRMEMLKRRFEFHIPTTELYDPLFPNHYELFYDFYSMSIKVDQGQSENARADVCLLTPVFSTTRLPRADLL